MSNNTSGYKGVWFEQRRKHWVAEIQVYGKDKYLGSFKSAESAALAYNKAAKSYHGEFAKLNEIRR